MVNVDHQQTRRRYPAQPVHQTRGEVEAALVEHRLEEQVVVLVVGITEPDTGDVGLLGTADHLTQAREGLRSRPLDIQRECRSQWQHSRCPVQHRHRRRLSVLPGPDEVGPADRGPSHLLVDAGVVEEPELEL